MYYATKRKNTTTRASGAAIVGVVFVVAGFGIANGFGSVMNKPKVETEVVMIEEQKPDEEPPPPPPPIDVDLPPPPPQVVLPEFTFDVPPPENAIQQVQVVRDPAPVAVKPAPPPPKPAPVLPPVRPVPDKDRFSKMMTEDYPQSALRKKQEGDVTVSMCVSVDGRASDVKLVRSSGVDALDDATVKGLPKLRFSPAKDGMGKPIAWCTPPYQLTVSWKLPKD